MLPDGTVKYIHRIVHPVFDEAGHVVEYVGSVLDVTERKRAEEALRRSEVYLGEGRETQPHGQLGGRSRHGQDDLLFGGNVSAHGALTDT